jgi:hypothetical protein
VTRLDREAVVVTVTAHTIRVRDVIWIGGRRSRVEIVTRLHNGARCRLAGGDLLALGNGREYIVERPASAPAPSTALSDTPVPRTRGAEYDHWSPWCLAASAGCGVGWAVLHGACKGPAEIIVPGQGTLRLSCGCPCHGEAAS